MLNFPRVPKKHTGTLIPTRMLSPRLHMMHIENMALTYLVKLTYIHSLIK